MPPRTSESQAERIRKRSARVRTHCPASISAMTWTYHLPAPDHERRVISKPGFETFATLASREQDVDRVEGDREEVVKEEQRLGREAVVPG